MFRKHSKNITQYLYQKNISKQNANHVLLDCMLSSNAHKIVFSLLDLLSMACLLPPPSFLPRDTQRNQGKYTLENRYVRIVWTLQQDGRNRTAARKSWNTRKTMKKTQPHPAKKTEMEIRKWKSLRQNRNSNQINQESAQALCTSWDMASGKFTSCTGIVNRCPMATDSLTHRLGKFMAGQTWYTVWFEWCVVCMCVCECFIYIYKCICVLKVAGIDLLQLLQDLKIPRWSSRLSEKLRKPSDNWMVHKNVGK